LKLWICSGETLSVALADQFFATFDDKGKILANFYGSTEVMGDVTYYLLTKRAQLKEMEKVPIGKNNSLPFQRLRLRKHFSSIIK